MQSAHPGARAGPVIWFHLDERVRQRAAIALLARVVEARPEVTVLLTTTRGVVLPAELPPGVVYKPRPVDLGPLADRFLADWAPQLAVFTGSDVMPAMLSALRDRGTPALLIDSRFAGQGGLAQRWSEFRLRGALRSLRRVMAAGPAEAEHFARIGVPSSRVEVWGPLEDPVPVLPCNESDLAGLNELLAARPVWLAARVMDREAEAVATAHAQAARLSHRLILIVAPDPDTSAQALVRTFDSRGWRVAEQAAGAEPEEDVQVYVADTEDQLGLWLRLAPVTFLGSSLRRGGAMLDPLLPAVLGSAVIHGPLTDPHGEAASRLDAAVASRRILTGNGLGDAICELLAPDRAATLAERAWDVATHGAETMDRAETLILDAVDGIPA